MIPENKYLRTYASMILVWFVENKSYWKLVNFMQHVLNGESIKNDTLHVKCAGFFDTNFSVMYHTLCVVDFSPWVYFRVGGMFLFLEDNTDKLNQAR